MTLTDALNWINGGWQNDQYARTENGKLGIDVDGLYGFQCMDFVVAYSRFLGASFANGNAISLINPQAGWTWVTSPQPGDVFVMDAVLAGKDYGHTGCVQSVAGTGFYSVDQDWFNTSLTTGSPPAQVFHEFDVVRGYQRFNNFEGDIMPTDQQIDEWISLFHQEAYGSPPTDAIFNDWRPVLKNNFVDGSLSIMQGTDTNAGALKNKPTNATELAPGLYKVG